MAYGDYLSPSKAALYIDQWLVEDCYDVRWQVDDSTSPSFDYARREYQAISPGKVMVSGSLAITFRYPGYLTTAIDDVQSRTIESPDSVKNANELSEFVSRMIGGT